MIIIVGGGITGLAAAYELAGRGAEFLLLEGGPRCGGLIRTEHADGFTIDAGPDSLLAQKPAALKLCDELGLASRLMSTNLPRTAFVLKHGRLHRLPTPSVLGIPTTFRALLGYDLLDWPARARLALEPLVPRRPLADESVASFFRRRFGSQTVHLIAEPLLGGIHAGDVERLSMPSVFPRLTDAERAGRRTAPPGVSTPPGAGEGLFRALHGGMGELVTAIESRLPPGSVRTNVPATSVGRRGHGWTVVAGGAAFDARSVLLAAPAHAAATLLPDIDPAAAQICATVPYVSTVSVALAWKRSDIGHPLNGSGFVVARRHNSLRITACTWVSSKWQHRAPPGYALIRAFIGGALDPGAVDLSDDELIQTAVRDVAGVLDIARPPALTRVVRWRNAGAQHNVGHRARMTGLAERLRALPGLFVAGSGFESIGIPDCVANGRRAAAAAADYATIG